jgi:hypothetical protein
LLVEKSHRRNNRYQILSGPLSKLAAVESTALTQEDASRVYRVDPVESTALTHRVYGVDSNRKEPSIKPSGKEWPDEENIETASLKAAPSQGEAPHVPPPPPSKSREKFTPPTRAELDLEAAKHGLPETQVTQFECFYGSKGWVVGKSPMKSWKLALAGWANRWRESGGRFQSQSTTPKPKPFHPHQKLIDEIRSKLATHPADMERVLDSGRQPTQEESREYNQLRDKMAELMMDNGGGK